MLSIQKEHGGYLACCSFALDLLGSVISQSHSASSSFLGKIWAEICHTCALSNHNAMMSNVVECASEML